MTRPKGSVTVFLALVFTSVSALLCALTESARTAGARFYVRNMTDSAIDSLFSQYRNDLWEFYRLLGRTCTDDSECAEAMEAFMAPYAEDCGWYAVGRPEAEITEKTFLTDGGGVWFEQEVVDYMKFGWISLDMSPENIETLWKDVAEARTMSDVLKDYGLQSRAAVRMEKAIMRIRENLDLQAELKRTARSQVREGNNDSFQATAARLSGTVNLLPGLINDYSRKAEAFSSELRRIEERHADDFSTLSEENRKTVEEQLSAFRAYTDHDGERRLEIEALDDRNDEELRIISDVREFADETQEYIDEYEEDEEEGDGLDEDALWAEVAEAWDRVPVPDFSCEFGIRDEETEGLLEKVMDLAGSGLLPLVLPAGTEVSAGIIPVTALPSSTSVTEREDGGPGLLTAAAVGEYAGKVLPEFTDKSGRPVAYELEYAVAGQDTDKENLESTVLRIMGIREALNFIHILRTPALFEKASNLAQRIGGAYPVLYAVVLLLVISAWSLAETVLDLRLLLSGKKAAFVKREEDWMCSIENLLAFAADHGAAEGLLREPEAGFTWEGYLKLLLFTKSAEERDYRIMDMIELNLMRRDPEFRMKDCLYGMHAEVTASSGHVFTSLGITGPYKGSVPSAFRIRTETVRAY